MPRRPYDLPPLSSISSFEAAARHVSFRIAARELNVTPAAISHQVKALELELGQPLFRRHARGVDLTESGAFLLVAVQRGFESISTAVAQLRRQSESAAVTIRATTAVSSLWLTPRLARFWKHHGHIAVTQHVTDIGAGPGESDLVIRYGDPDQDGGDCRVLFRDRILVLASPGVAARCGVERLDDLAGAELIHVSAEDTTWTDWRGWANAIGYRGPIGAGLEVNNYTIALQAARDDMGLVLGWEKLTRPLIESGELVPVLDEAIEAPRDFYIRMRPHVPERVRLLRDWLAGHDDLVPATSV